MAIPSRKTIYQDGIILWAAYHLFDILRQVSIFQQIRNLSKWWWNFNYRKKHPNATKEQHDKDWNSSRPFTSGYLFPEVWVIFNIIFAILGCTLIWKTSPVFIRWFFLVYALMRMLELFVYQINVLLFDPIKCGLSKYRIKSATRIVLLLICNIFEYILWFSVIYLFMYKNISSDIDGLKIFFESITTLANISSPEEIADYEKKYSIMFVAHIESVVGIFMNIICLARFISLLPPVQTMNDN